ncbi:MAG: TetR/AcrR family transcriptional regulator, partial [Nakamurella sp.]
MVEVRRPPYGRNPALAAHGVRARREIVEAARELFGRKGYMGTTVEAIGEATGRSGAAVYQYFEGKVEIFEAFMRESTAELITLGEQFPVLTDDSSGVQALQVWVGDLMQVFLRHKGTFLGWAQVQFNEPKLAAIGQANLKRFQQSIVERLVASGAHPPTPGVVPVGILSFTQWSLFMYVAQRPEFSQERLERAVAATLHAYLFTPAESAGRWPATSDGDELPSIPLGDVLGLRRPVTARGVGTVQRILLAASERFSQAGYNGTSLSDIAATAGVSHGSVYTYWADREALFTTLAQDACAALELRVQGLDQALRTPDGLSSWLHNWVAMLDVHGAVLFTWTHEVIDLPGLSDLTERMNSAMNAAADTFIDRSALAPMEDPKAMCIAVRAILADVPYVLSTQLGILE